MKISQSKTGIVWILFNGNNEQMRVITDKRGLSDWINKLPDNWTIEEYNTNINVGVVIDSGRFTDDKQRQKAINRHTSKIVRI